MSGVEFSLRVGPRYYRHASQGFHDLARKVSNVPTAVSQPFRSLLLEHLQSVARKVAARNSGNATTDSAVRKRSGSLVSTLEEGIRVDGGSIGNLVARFTGVDYLMIHEEGGVIRARKSQYLTIPLDAALNSDGTPRFPTAREWANTFVGRSKKGNLLIFQRRGRAIIPLYALRKEVTIKPRLGLKREIFDAGGLKAFSDKFAAEVMKEILR